MDFTELISNFAEHHGIADLAAEDNAAALDIDGIVVTLIAIGDTLSVSAEIGESPIEGKADFADLMLETNLQSDAFFAKEPERDTYILVRRLSLTTLGSDALDEALEALVNMAETWRRLLADFRPIAKVAAEQATEEPSFGAGGFVQV